MRWLTERRLIRLILSVLLLSVYGCAASSDAIRGGADGDLLVVGEEICQDVKTGKMWQIAKEGVFNSPEEARQYAETLSIGGYDDWRLPTRDELFDLYCIFFWERNGNCTMNRNGNFWSMSEVGVPLLGHWETYFLCAPEHKYVRSLGTRGYVRAVRP